MKREIGWSLLVALGLPIAAIPCHCRGPKPACAYLGADAIFLGRVSFTNDDGSGRFTQATLVRFDVEERFKGIPAAADHVWVDPGSFTSCYRTYNPGERYLIFATKSRFPRDSASMAVVGNGSRKLKQSPPGFDPVRDAVYNSAECSGSRSARDFP